MDAQSNTTLLTLSILLNFFASAAAFALSETRVQNADSYQVIVRNYVSVAQKAVEAHCETGDVLVSGQCTGLNTMEFSSRAEVRLSSNESEKNRTRLSCVAPFVHRQQTLRITATAHCQRAAKTPPAGS